MGKQPGKDRTPGGGKEYYETDPDFYDICNYEFRFILDAAAEHFNAKCKNFLCKEFNAVGPKVKWEDVVRHVVIQEKSEHNSIWLNPPYSRGMVPLFLERSYQASQNGITVVCLVHTCTDTKYWYDWIWDKAAEVRHIHGRLRFWLPESDKGGNFGTTSDLPHSLIIYRPYYLGRTYQSIWNWKNDYIYRFGALPIRDIRSPSKNIKGYIRRDGSKEYL